MKKIFLTLTTLLLALVLVGCKQNRYDDHYIIVFFTDELVFKETVQVEKDSIFPKPADLESPFADFEGWYKDVNYTEEFDFTKPITESTTIYVKWDYHTFNITYMLEEDAINHPSNPTSIKVNRLLDGDELRLNSPTREGYIFRSWHFEEDLSDSPVQFLTKENVDDDVVLYPRWRALN